MSTLAPPPSITSGSWTVIVVTFAVTEEPPIVMLPSIVALPVTLRLPVAVTFTPWI